jgi:hypothetical protein
VYKKYLYLNSFIKVFIAVMFSKYFKIFFLFLFMSYSLHLMSMPSFSGCEEKTPAPIQECGKYAFSRFTLKHREHHGMGFDQGYSTLQLFLCPNFKLLALPIFDARFHVFNGGDLASNIGLGTRISNEKGSFILGLNAYYDFRNHKSFSSHQLAAGLELLTPSFDIRLNAYQPFSGKYDIKGPYFYNFQGHYAYSKEKILYAFPSCDAEIGFTLPDPFTQIGGYLSIGSYYLFKQKAIHHSAGHTLGGRIRLNCNPADYISFGAEYTYDHLFKNRANGFFAFHIPIGSRKINKSTIKRYPYKKSACDIQLEKMKMKAQDVVRNEIIPFYNKKYIDQLEPYFVFVNNKYLAANGVGSGNGTFEHPYTTLALAQDNSSPGDVVYVFFGSGNSSGYDKGFVMQRNQTLTSSALPFSINPITIPASTPGQFPTVTNTSTNAVITASNTQQVIIQGFNIYPNSALGIFAEYTGLTCLNNFVNVGITIPVYHLNPIGKNLIMDNYFNKQGTGLAGPLAGIILVSNTSPTITESYQILSNTLLQGDAKGILIQNFGNRIVIDNNIVSTIGSSATVIAIQNNNTTLTTSRAHITNNTIIPNNLTSIGIGTTSSNNAIIQANISNNSFTEDAASGSYVSIAGSSSSKEPTCLSIAGNLTASSFQFQNTGTGFFQLSPSDNRTAQSFQDYNNPDATYSYSGSIYFVPQGSPCPPCTAVYVNNASRSPVEDGSFVNPWKNLSSAQDHSVPNDLIYVFEGTGEPAPGYTTGFTLQDNQIIVGSGTPFNYKGATIQPLTEGSPKITNTAPLSNVITVPSSVTNCSIIGLDLIGLSQSNSFSTGNAIYCSGNTIGLILIENNFITSANGIYLYAPNGDLSILNNTISSFEGSPLYISTCLYALIQGNLMNNSSSTPGPGFVYDNPASSTLTVTSNSFQGFTVSSSFNVPSSTTLNMSNNTFIADVSTTSHISATFNGTFNCTLFNNAFTPLIPLPTNATVNLISHGQGVYNITDNFFAPGYSTINIEYPAASACITAFSKNTAETFIFSPGQGGSGSAQINTTNQKTLENTNNPQGHYLLHNVTFKPPGSSCP